jgi:hypothetical protein
VVSPPGQRLSSHISHHESATLLAQRAERAPTMGHRWDRSARRVEKLRARLEWQMGGTEPLRPRGMHKRTYQRILGMLAYHEAIRKQGASYVRKDRPDQHRAHLWRQCRNRFVVLVGGQSANFHKSAGVLTAAGPPVRWRGFVRPGLPTGSPVLTNRQRVIDRSAIGTSTLQHCPSSNGPDSVLHRRGHFRLLLPPSAAAG